MRVSLRLLAIVAATFLVAAPASAHDHYLHAHVDAYNQHFGFGCKENEWSSPRALCSGRDEHSRGQGGTGQPMKITWCGSTGCLPPAFHRLQLPAGYSRWMSLCVGNVGHGVCADDIVGAVRMPNGPFLVMGGTYDLHTLKAADPSKPNESRGGPLFLHVGFHGYQRDHGGTPTHGYVFGFRGFLQW